MIDNHVWTLGRNYVIAREQAMSNLERSDKFQQTMITCIIAGGPNEEYI